MFVSQIIPLGDIVGFCVGSEEGSLLGSALGSWVGDVVGASEGKLVGSRLGS